MSRTLRLVFFLVGATLVTLMVWHAGPAQLWIVFRSSLWVIAGLIPLWAGVYVCNALAWRLLTSDGGVPISLPRAFLITLVTFAVNYSTPLASFGGEPLKVVAATRFLGKRRAVGSVVAFRLLHALAHVLAWLVALIPGAILLPHTPLILGGVVAIGTVLTIVLVFLFSRHREGLAMHALGLLRRLPLLSKVAAKLEPRAAAFHEIDAHVTAVYTKNPRQFYAALACEMLGRVLALAEYWVILYGMGLHVNPLMAFVVGSFSSLVVNILIFLPFELGAKEGALYIIFGWIGVTPALGIAAAALSRMRELIWIAIGWGLIWTMS